MLPSITLLRLSLLCRMARTTNWLNVTCAFLPERIVKLSLFPCPYQRCPVLSAVVTFFSFGPIGLVRLFPLHSAFHSAYFSSSTGAVFMLTDRSAMHSMTSQLPVVERHILRRSLFAL